MTPIAAQQSVVVPLGPLDKEIDGQPGSQRSRQGFSTGKGRPLILPPNRKTI